MAAFMKALFRAGLWMGGLAGAAFIAAVYFAPRLIPGSRVRSDAGGLQAVLDAMDEGHKVKAECNRVGVPTPYMTHMKGGENLVNLHIDTGPMAGSGIECNCAEESNCSDLVAENMARLLKKEPVSRPCSPYYHQEIRIIDAAAQASQICPGQALNSADQRLHNGLFLPAVPPSSDVRGVLQFPAQDLGTECASTSSENCSAYTAGTYRIYCGAIDSRNGDPATPEDVALSDLYYRLLAAADRTSDVGIDACPERSTSLFIATLADEVITASTWKDFVEASQFTPQAKTTLSAIFEEQLQNHPAERACVLVSLTRDDPDTVSLNRVRDALAFPVFRATDALKPTAYSPLLEQTLSRFNNGSSDPILKRLEKKAFVSPDAPAAESHPGAPAEKAVDCRTVDSLPPEDCHWICRMCKHLKTVQGLERPHVSSDDVLNHLGTTGPFHVTDYDTVASSFTLSLPEGKVGVPVRLKYSIPLYSPTVLVDTARQCKVDGSSCLIEGVWSRALATRLRDAGAQSAAADTTTLEHPSMLGLFGVKADGSRDPKRAACLRAAMRVLADSYADPGKSDKGPSANAVIASSLPPHETVSSRPTDIPVLGVLPTVRGDRGLLPSVYQQTWTCENEKIKLAYVEEEPWEETAKRVRDAFTAAGVGVELVPITSARLRSEEDPTWDAVITVATRYTSGAAPTLSTLFHPGARFNYSRGELAPDARKAWYQFEKTVAWPTPWASDDDIGVPPTRAEALAALETAVFNGPAPMFVLNWVKPETYVVNPINPEMRALQFGTSDPYVLQRVASASDQRSTESPLKPGAGAKAPQ